MTDVILNILTHTYHPDKNLRTNAEKALEEYLLTSPTALQSLIAIIKNRDISVDLRKSSAILVKNEVKKNWEPRKDDEKNVVFEKYSLEQKEILKTEVVLTILDEYDNSIRRLLAEIFRKLVEYEYPAKWPNLLQVVLSMAQTDVVLRMHNALVLIRQIAKRFEFKPIESRQPLNELIQLSFPNLQGLLAQIINNNSTEAAFVMKVCLKIFFSSTHFLLPTNVSGIDVNYWFQVIATILRKDLPEGNTGLEPLGQPIEKEDRQNWVWWKLKKWAIRISVIFIQRYGNPRSCNDENVQFAEFFKNHTSKVLLEPVLYILQQKSIHNVYVSDEVHRMSLCYANNCVEMAPTYKLIKPHLDWILFNVVFGAFPLTAEETELFTDDASEFVRKVHDPSEEWIDLRLAAINLLQMAARYREKDTLPRVMNHIQSLLVEYAKNPSDPVNARNKDAIIVAIGALAPVLSESKTYKTQIEPFFLHHIIPEFVNPNPIIRFRAFWVIEYYQGLAWKQDNTFHTILKGCLNGLRDPSIPVQAAAATSMRNMFEDEKAHDVIQPILKEVLAEYFRLMDEVDSSSILTVVQSIVMNFGDELGEIAPAMIKKIMESFAEYFAEASEENDEAAFNAAECLETILSILEVVTESNPEVLTESEAYCVPVIVHMLNSEMQCYEYIENMIAMLGFFTYFPETITPNVWNICGPLLSALNNWAFDYMLEITTPLLNYISKDVNQFMSLSYEGVSHVDRLMAICEKGLLYDDSSSSREGKSSCVLLTCLITSCQQKQLPRELIAKAMELVLTKIGKLEIESKTSKTYVEQSCIGIKVKLLEVAMAVMIYDTPYCLEVLKMNDVASKLLFNQLFFNLVNMDEISSQKLIIMSFSSIMTCLPAINLPPAIRDNLFPMLQQMIREIQLLKQNEIDRANEEGSVDDDMNDDDEEIDEEAILANGRIQVPDGGFDEDEDCINVEDESYREYLNSLTSNEDKARHILYKDGEMQDYNENEEDVALEYIGLHDKVNVVKFFIEAMKVAEQKDPSLMQALQSQLTAEDKGHLQAYIIEAQSA